MIFLNELTLISVKRHLQDVVYVIFIIFLDKNFTYGPFLCNGCYDMSLKAVSMQNLTIINHNGNHYRVKKDVYYLIKKREHYKVKINNFCLCIL